MSSSHDNKVEQQTGWFDKPENVSRLLWGFYLCCGVLFVLDFVINRHIYTDLESIPGFYPLFGFVACVLLVLIAKELRKVVMRKEDYYDPQGSEPASSPTEAEGVTNVDS